MQKNDQNPKELFLHRMCPPNRKINFFFSNPLKPQTTYENSNIYLFDLGTQQIMSKKKTAIHNLQ